MTDKPIAAFTDAYKLGLIAAGIPDGPRVGPMVNIQDNAANQPDNQQSDEPLMMIAERLRVVGQAEASAASNISAQRLAEVQAEVVADTARLIAGQYKRLG